jgi:thiamine biosynthesis lipoprotein
VTEPGEAGATFACFGSTCAVFVTGEGALGSAAEAVAFAQGRLLAWHARFSRFESSSELSRLNADPSPSVAVSRDLARLATAVVAAAEQTGGLVDATLVDEIEVAGYRGDLSRSAGLAAVLDLAPPRRPAAGRSGSRWREIRVEAGTVTRPPGVKIDGGGLAKGIFADLLAAELATHTAFAIDCAGDLRLGGTAGIRRQVLVASPFMDATLHAFDLTGGGVATSGIGKRSWLDADGAPAHHLLDPSTGRPAFTGIVQVTALASTGLEAEVRAKAALLAGPGRTRKRLIDGGVVVYDDASFEVVPAGRPNRPVAPARRTPACPAPPRWSRRRG